MRIPNFPKTQGDVSLREVPSCICSCVLCANGTFSFNPIIFKSSIYTKKTSIHFRSSLSGDIVIYRPSVGSSSASSFHRTNALNSTKQNQRVKTAFTTACLQIPYENQSTFSLDFTGLIPVSHLRSMLTHQAWCIILHRRRGV